MNVKLNDKDKIQIGCSDDLYGIMQRILLRDNKIDREKEHFWIVGMNVAGIILYIELVSLGSVKETLVEPMNVFRVAVLKGATRVIAVHNHPSGKLKPSKNDIDITDHLFQVGKILNIELLDHIIINPTNYMGFKDEGLMDQIALSTKYVPPYVLIEKIRAEEKKIRIEAEKKIRLELEKSHKRELKEKDRAIVENLLANQMSIEQIARILQLTPEEVKKIGKRKKK